jgi:hypothetical protein
MADLATWFIQQTALSLIMHPFDKEDQELIDEDIPAPMYPGLLIGSIASRNSHISATLQSRLRCQ